MGKEKDVTLRKVAGIANMAHWPMLRNCPQHIAKAASWAIRKEIKNIIAPLSQTPKNSFKRWPSPRNDLVVSNKLFQGPFIPLLWILFGQTGYPIKFFTYK